MLWDKKELKQRKGWWILKKKMTKSMGWRSCWDWKNALLYKIADLALPMSIQYFLHNFHFLVMTFIHILLGKKSQSEEKFTNFPTINISATWPDSIHISYDFPLDTRDKLFKILPKVKLSILALDPISGLLLFLPFLYH